MSVEAVARRYARAIFELGREKAELEAITRELGDLAQAYGASDELRNVLANPMLGDAAREGIIGDLARRLGSSAHTTSLVRLLARRRRLAALPEIVRQLGEMVDEDQGILRANVRAAAPLGAGYLDKLKARIEQVTGRRVMVHFEQDPALIAGVVTQIGDQIVDGSVRGKLDQLRESLHQT